MDKICWLRSWKCILPPLITVDLADSSLWHRVYASHGFPTLWNRLHALSCNRNHSVQVGFCHEYMCKDVRMSINLLILFKSSWFDGVYKHRGTGWSFVHKMACQLEIFGIELLYKLVRLITIKLVIIFNTKHDDVIKWKHYPCYWPFVRGIHRSPHKGQWCRAFMFSLICVWINGWVNNREAGD